MEGWQMVVAWWSCVNQHTLGVELVPLSLQAPEVVGLVLDEHFELLYLALVVALQAQPPLADHRALPHSTALCVGVLAPQQGSSSCWWIASLAVWWMNC